MINSKCIIKENTTRNVVKNIIKNPRYVKK